MFLSKPAAMRIAQSEIARSQSNNEKSFKIEIYNNDLNRWVFVGKIGAKGSREFERRYIENRATELLKTS